MGTKYTGNGQEIVKFGSRQGAFFELSPFYFCTFTIGGMRWRTLIHYWCASFYKDNRVMQEVIRGLDTPEMAIRTTFKYGLHSFAECDPKKIILGVQERFNQCDTLRSILLSTGDAYLEYVGAGYLAENNRYGKLLMKVRDIYNNEV